MAPFYGGRLTDYSALVGTTTDDYVPANQSRKYLLIQNSDTAAMVYVSFDEAAVVNTDDTTSGSFKLVPGASLIFGEGGGFVPTGVVHAISSASTTPVVIWEA